eukprot:scaffold93610_cov19-Prasinocladus_malaysianus.AAC.1
MQGRKEGKLKRQGMEYHGRTWSLTRWNAMKLDGMECKAMEWNETRLNCARQDEKIRREKTG